MESRRDDKIYTRPISKFEEMSGFKEIESVSKDNLTDKILDNSVMIMEMLLEVLNNYVIPFCLGGAIVVIVFDLVFYGANMVYNFFRLILLSVLLFYRYKRGKF